MMRTSVWQNRISSSGINIPVLQAFKQCSTIHVSPWSRLEKELEQLENGISASSTKENMAEETTRVVVKEEKLPHTPKVRTSFFLSSRSPHRVVVRME